jgi:hypothetical protein
MQGATKSLHSRIAHSFTYASTCRMYGANAGLWILSLLVVTAYGSSWDRGSLAHLPAAVPLFAPTGAPNIARPPSSSNKKSFRKKDLGSKDAGSKKTKNVKKKKKSKDIPLSESQIKLSRSEQKRKVLAKRSFLPSQVEKSNGRRRIIRKKTSPKKRKEETDEKAILTKRKMRKKVPAAKVPFGAGKSNEVLTSSSTLVGVSLQKMEREKVKRVRKKKLDTPRVDVVSSHEQGDEATSESNMTAISVNSGNISSLSTKDDRDTPAPVLIPDAEEPTILSPNFIVLSNVAEKVDPILTSDNSTDPVGIQNGEASHDVVSIQPIDDLSTSTPKVEIDSEFLYSPENASTAIGMSEKVMCVETELVDSAQILSQMEITMEISSSIDFIDLNDSGQKDSFESVSLHGMNIGDEGKNSTFTIQSSQSTSGTQIQAKSTYGIEGSLFASNEHINEEASRVPEVLVVHDVDALSLSSNEISQQNASRYPESILAKQVASLSPGDVSPAVNDSRMPDPAFALSNEDRKGVDYDDEIDIGSEFAFHSQEFDEENDGDDRAVKESNRVFDELDDEDDDEGFDANVASQKTTHTNFHENEDSEMPSHEVETGSEEKSAIESSTDADACTKRFGIFEPSTNLAESCIEKDAQISIDNSVEAHSGKPDLKVSVVTWNLAEESPLPDDACFIKHFRDNGKGRETGSDLVLISGQECENIKPRRSEGSRSREFRRLLILMLGKDYVPIAMHLLGGIQFCLFCKRSILSDIQKASVADVTCGIGNVFHNKGAIGCFLQMKANNKSHGEGVQRKSKSIRMLFVTAHMAAHVKNTEARDSDFWRIVRELEIQAPTSFLPKRNSDTEATGQFLLESMDRIFFCGDLNYRIDLPREEVEYAVQRIRSITESRNPKTLPDADELRQSLLQYDQLRATMALGRAFPGFVESPITFAPTFKFDKGTDDYDTSPKQRIPAWTDRILFKPVGTQVSIYNSVETARHSDHRPVFATFLVDMTGRDLPLGNRKRQRTAGTTRKKNE